MACGRCAGFSGSFWASYHEVIPRAPGFEERHQLYQLYHYMNHYNLFGSGTVRGQDAMLKGQEPCLSPAGLSMERATASALCSHPF